MPTDLPYAADAEVSLSPDELAVCTQSAPAGHTVVNDCFMVRGLVGLTDPVREGIESRLRFCSDQVQLCVGACEESKTRASGGGRPVAVG